MCLRIRHRSSTSFSTIAPLVTGFQVAFRLFTDLTLLSFLRTIALEKRQKRRESHNAVERRRRDNINDRIAELAVLLPECLLEQVISEDLVAPGSPPQMSSIALMGTSPAMLNISQMSISTAAPGAQSSSSTAMAMMMAGGSMMSSSAGTSAITAATAAKLNKGIILSKSVDYIRYLQQLVDLHSSRNAELERTVYKLRMNADGGGRSCGATSSSSEDRSPRELHVVETVGAGLHDPDFNSKFLISAARGEFGRGGEKWGFRNDNSSNSNPFDEDDDMDG